MSDQPATAKPTMKAGAIALVIGVLVAVAVFPLLLIALVFLVPGLLILLFFAGASKGIKRNFKRDPMGGLMLRQRRKKWF